MIPELQCLSSDRVLPEGGLALELPQLLWEAARQPVCPPYPRGGTGCTLYRTFPAHVIFHAVSETSLDVPHYGA